MCNKSLNQISFKISGTCLEIINCPTYLLDAIKELQISKEDYHIEGSKLSLDNQKNYFIYENEFIITSQNLCTIISKLVDKEYKAVDKVFDSEKKEFLDIPHDLYTDKYLYHQVTRNNIIYGHNIKNDNLGFNLSVNVLHYIFSNSANKSRRVLNTFILFSLANKVVYTASKVTAEFFSDSDTFKYEFEINNSLLDVDLYSLYDWIFNDKEYKDSHNLKLNIVRQVIVRARSILYVDDILEDCKYILLRIVANNTADYFDQLNKLKEDFIRLSERMNSVLRTLHIALFGWLSYVVICISNIALDYPKEKILNYLWYETGISQIIIVWSLIISIALIFIGYWSEIKLLQKQYETLKALYKNKLLFEKDDKKSCTKLCKKSCKFEDFMDEPRVNKYYCSLFICVVIALLFRLYHT